MDIYLSDERVSAAVLLRPSLRHPLPGLKLKRGDHAPLHVVVLGCDDASALRLGIKRRDEHESELLVLCGAAAGTVRDDGTHFDLVIDAGTESIRDALAVGDAGSLPQVMAMAEFDWVSGGVRRVSETVPVVICNDVVRDEDAPPVDDWAEWPDPAAVATQDWVRAQLEIVEGTPGPQGEPGPAPAHEWQGTSLRFSNPDGTWGDLVNLQGPQGEAGTGGGGSITIDDTPTSGSDNAVSSGGVYNYLKNNNVAIGKSSGPLPPGYNWSVAVGASAWADGSSSTAVGHVATAEADSSVALGHEARAEAMKSVALGVAARAEAESSCVLGAGGYIADTGVTVLNAGGGITDGKSTQLYLIPAGSDMANLYTGGAAGLGFVVLDHLSGSVVARGTIPLAALCTAHAADFSPTNVTSISGY